MLDGQADRRESVALKDRAEATEPLALPKPQTLPANRKEMVKERGCYNAG